MYIFFYLQLILNDFSSLSNMDELESMSELSVS